LKLLLKKLKPELRKQEEEKVRNEKKKKKTGRKHQERKIRGIPRFSLRQSGMEDYSEEQKIFLGRRREAEI
jgi:hypothetical protein